MSQADPPEVLQGRLGWESGDISEAKPGELEPHPKNKEIYDDTESAADLDTTFTRSVSEKGVLEPLVITEGKQIISGHRRWLAANEAGLEKVPVRYAEFDSDLAEREALIEFNRQREKTPGQLVNEFHEMLEIERERVEKERREKISETQTKRKNSETSETFHRSQDGDNRAKTRAAEKVNAPVSGRTLEKGLKVKEKAEEGDETARDQWDKLQRGETSFSRASLEVKKAEADEKETPELPDGVYSVLYADPPWQYDFAETSNRAIENQYGTMSLSEIKGLDVPAADDAVLYLWTTAPKLEEGLDVLRAWGFEYVTNAVWDKQKIGMGYWFRGQHELLLVGKRGSFSPPETDARVSSVISVPRSEHSAKPEAVRELIENAFPEEPKLELFARVNRDGWDSWGDEA